MKRFSISGNAHKKTKTTVLRYVQHPLSTVMEGIRTMRNVTLGIRTRYDEFCTHSAFKFANKCDSYKCMCQRYCQRKRMKTINPALCQLCINTENTMYCVQHELILDCFFSLSSCKECSFQGLYCKACDNELLLSITEITKEAVNKRDEVILFE